MKKQNKFLLLFLSIIILLVQTISILPFSVGVDTSDAIIIADDMYVTYGDFVDTSPDSRENKLWWYTGGKDLISFTNLGVSNTETTDEVLVYEAEVIFGFEMIMYTSVAFDNIYPDIEVENIVEAPFFGVGFIRLYPPAVWQNIYAVGYNDVILGEKVPHDYTGSIPLTVGFKEWTGKRPLVVNGVEISTPWYTADISNVKTVNIRGGEVGSYEDIFVDSTGFREGTVDFTKTEDTPTDTSDTIDWLEGKNIGWTGSEKNYNTGIQEYVRTAPPIEKDNPDPAEVKDFSFNVPAQLRPEVYRIKNDIELRTAAIIFEQQLLGDWKLTVVSQPATRMVKRTVGVHVVNQFIYWDFTVKMIVYASVENSAELSESILSDPYLEMGDFIWDTGYVGAREIDIRIPDEPDWLEWWDEWGWLVILILVSVVGIYLFIQVGMPLILLKAKSKILG